MARIIDYSSRLAEDKTKLSTRFNEILEVLYESSTWAEIDGSDFVTRDHVEKAISEKIYRSNRIEERILSMIEKGEILVDTEGSVEGKFHIYTAETIDDAIEIMTGMAPEEFHQKVKASLMKMAETALKHSCHCP